MTFLKTLLWLWLKCNIAYFYWWTLAYHIKTMALHAPLMYLSSEKKMFHCNLLCSSKNQKLFKKNFWNQSSHYENYRWFPLQMEAITCLPQNQFFLWWAKMNGIQRRTLVGPHCTYSGMAKGILLGLKRHQNSEKIKPVAFMVYPHNLLRTHYIVVVHDIQFDCTLTAC